MKKILLGDDHPIIRSALKEIKGNYLLHSFADTVEEELIYELAKSEEYSMIILSVNIPHTDSARLVTNILDIKPESKILMFNMLNEELYAKYFLELGVMGYLTKASQEQDIKNAIGNVLDNMRYVSASVLEDLARDIFSEKLVNPFERLSKRELEVLGLMLKGKQIADISEELDVEVSTAGSYRERILKKLNCLTVPDINLLAGVYNFSLH